MTCSNNSKQKTTRTERGDKTHNKTWRTLHGEHHRAVLRFRLCVVWDEAIHKFYITNTPPPFKKKKTVAGNPYHTLRRASSSSTQTGALLLVASSLLLTAASVCPSPPSNTNASLLSRSPSVSAMRSCKNAQKTKKHQGSTISWRFELRCLQGRY